MRHVDQQHDAVLGARVHRLGKVAILSAHQPQKLPKRPTRLSTDAMLFRRALVTTSAGAAAAIIIASFFFGCCYNFFCWSFFFC